MINAMHVAKSFGDAGLPGIFVYNGRSEVFDRFVETGADVRRADFPVASRKTHLNPFYRREYSRKLARFIEDESIDVVQLFPRGAYMTHYMKGLDVLQVAQQPYSSPDLRPMRLFQNGFTFHPKRLLNAWYRKYVRWDYSKADLVTGLGYSHQQASMRVFGVPEYKTVVVHPGVAPQKQLAEPGSLRREFDIPDDAKVVLSVGRITRAKGVEEFGEIARLLKERGKSYRFLFAGSSVRDEYETEIRERYGEFVTFIGHRYDIPTCFADADLYLHPSHREGLPMVIMESMEFGLPAVVWDIPGCTELVTNGENGSVLKFGDVEAAADEIERYFEDQATYERVSSAARAMFEERFDIAKYAPRMMDIYKKAIAEKAKR